MERSLLKIVIIISILTLIPIFVLAEINQPEYFVNVILDPEGKAASSEVTIKWINDSGVDLETVGLSIYYDGFSINSFTDLKINGIERDIDQYAKLYRNDDYYERFYLIHDDSDFKNGEEIILQFKYTVRDVSSSYGFIHYTGSWFPTLMPIVNSEPNELRNQWAKYHVTASYPLGWNSCSTGVLKNTSEKDSTITRILEAEEVTNFAILLFKEFIHLEGESKGVKIHSFYREGDDWCGEFLLDKAEEVVAFYVKEFGYYPQPIINILPGAEKPYGGYPVAANCLVVHRGLDESRADFTNWILSHEIGHMYWGFGNILEDLTGCRWFGLSMGIYSDWLYSQYAGISPERHKSFENRYINGVIYGYNTDISQTMPQLYSQDGMDWNNVVAHGKSFTVLKTLHDYIGAETFRKIHQHLLDEYPGKTVTMDEFQTVCETLSGRELGQFFHFWYRSNSILDYRISETKRHFDGENWITEISISRLGETIMPIDVEVTYENGESEVKTIDGWEETESVKFSSKESGCKVKLDPENKLPLLIHYLEDFDFVVSMGSALVNNGDLLKGRELLNLAQGLGIESTPKLVYFLAKEKMLRGEYEGVIKQLEPLFAMTEGDHLPFYKGHGNIIAGKTFDLLGQREKAKEYYMIAKEYEDSMANAEKFLSEPYEIR